MFSQITQLVAIAFYLLMIRVGAAQRLAMPEQQMCPPPVTEPTQRKRHPASTIFSFAGLPERCFSPESVAQVHIVTEMSSDTGSPVEKIIGAYQKTTLSEILETLPAAEQ